MPADSRCPHPERWTSTDGDSTELEVQELLVGLVRALQPDLVVETGTGLGQATARMVWALARNGRGRLVGCDTSPDRLQATRQAVDATRWWKVAPLVIDLRLCSGSELELEPDATVDLAYLDSCYRCRVPELLHLRRWLRPGAVVAVHDTRPEAGSHEIEGGLSLRQALQRDVVAPGLARAIDLPTPRGLTLLEVLP